MTPLEIYNNDIKEHGFQKDAAQLQAVLALDNLYHEFHRILEHASRETKWLEKLV